MLYIYKEKEIESMIVTVGLLERTRGDRRGKENDRK
jgi:hypothetical protein